MNKENTQEIFGSFNIDMVWEPGWWEKLKVQFLGSEFKWRSIMGSWAYVATGFEYDGIYYVMNNRKEPLTPEEEVRKIEREAQSRRVITPLPDSSWNRQGGMPLNY